jgi:hypothetical protein
VTYEEIRYTPKRTSSSFFIDIAEIQGTCMRIDTNSMNNVGKNIKLDQVKFDMGSPS